MISTALAKQSLSVTWCAFSIIKGAVAVARGRPRFRRLVGRYDTGGILLHRSRLKKVVSLRPGWRKKGHCKKQAWIKRRARPEDAAEFAS